MEPFDAHPARRHPNLNQTRLLSLVGLLVLGVLLAACGASSSTSAATGSAPPSSSPAGSGGATNTAALQAFRSCLTQHGVNLPTVTPRTTIAGQTPPSSPGGAGAGRFSGGSLNAVFTNPADAAAVQACQSTLPAGYLAQQQARANQRVAFNSCMADHGVTVAPATPGSPPSTLDTSSAAYKACSPLLPSRPQGAPGGPTTSTSAP